MLPNSFRVFGELDLSKSLATLTGKGTPGEPYKDFIIKGRVLNQVRDEQGERPIVAEMDWGYFDKQGFVKAEHDPITTKINKSDNSVEITSTPIFTNIIGAPLKRSRVNGNEEHIEAGLFTRLEKAKEIIELMKSLDEWNKHHPDRTRTIGWSIEGSYLKKSKSNEYVGKVYNIALTANPQDKTTYAEMANTSNLAMAKSLAAGYATTPATKKDGGALREESLEGSQKNKSNSGGKTMKFASHAECSKYHISKGKSKEDAKKLADQYFADKKSAEESSSSEMSKSLTTVTDGIKKSVDALGAIVKASENQPDELVRIDLSMKKSIQVMNAEPDPEKRQIDGVELMINLQKSILSSHESLQSQIVALAKSMTGIAEAQTELAKMVKSAYDQSFDGREFAEAGVDRVTRLIMGAKSVEKSIQTAGIGQLEPAGGDAGAGADDKMEQFRKSVTKTQIENYLVDKGISTKEGRYFQAQETYRKSGWAGLNSAIRTEIVTALAPGQ